MPKPLNILIVEDSPGDAELALLELRRAGFEPKWKRVETEPDFLSAIAKSPDIILSDYSMPQFSGLRAVELLRKSGLDIPFILISGTVGEEVAVEAMKQGVTDYLLKDRVARLGIAVERALEEKRLRDERNRVEKALRQSREEFKDLFDNAPVGFHEVDAAGRMVRVNNTELKMLGFSAEELLGQFVWKIAAAEELSRKAVLAQLNGKGMPEQAFERMLRRKDGSTFPAIINNRRLKREDGTVIGIRAGIQDITDRKRAEEAVRASQEQLQSFVEQAPVSIAMFDRDMRYLITSRRWLSDFGKGHDNLAGLHHYDLHRDLPESWKEIHQKGLAGEFVKNDEDLWVHADGNKQWLRWAVQPWRNAVGAVGGIIISVDDITERKHGEEALQESQALYHSLVDELPVGIFRKDRAGRFVFANPWFCQLRGLQLDQILGRTADELVALEEATHGRTRPEVLKSIREGTTHHEEIMRTGKPIQVEEIHPTAGKDKRYLHVLKSAVFGPNGKIIGTQGVQFEITDQHRLQEQLRQSQKMEAIGQLAGGVAHDFNNILAVIEMQADLMKDEGATPLQIENIKEISAAAARGAALTRQLLLFSRKETMRLQDLDLNESINNMTKMLRRTLGENIQIQFKFAMQSLLMHADAGMIDQVLMNLAVNARDAMPGAGKLVIETSAVEFDETVAAQSPKGRSGSFVCLEVSDTGCGIPPENLTRIFEPFFTTKEVGKGTGLGLATVFGIVQQHQGWINVYSEVNRGTTFRIYLPRLAAASGQKIEPPSLEALPRGNETILLVEDDPFVRDSVCRTLSRLGYQVLEANNGTEALKVWKQNHDKIRLVLTDMVMPGDLNGKQLGERLLKEEPGLKLIYASGYSAEVAENGLLVEEGIDFLTKPFPAAKLAQTIRARLDH